MIEQPLDLSVIIVSWNVRTLLDECLYSVMPCCSTPIRLSRPKPSGK